MKKHCEVRLVDIFVAHDNTSVRSQSESLQQKQTVPKQTSRSMKAKSNHIPKPKKIPILKQGNKIEENKQNNNLKRKLAVDTMNLLLDQRPLKLITTNKKEVKTSKNSNKKKKMRCKTFWESKLTGAKRVSKRLSKLKKGNKTLELKYNKNNDGLLKNKKEHSIKFEKKKIMRNNEQLNTRVKTHETKITNFKIPIRDNNLNIPQKSFSKIFSKPYKRGEVTNICKRSLGNSVSSFTHDKETIPVTSVVTSRSGSWSVKENKDCNTNESDIVITTYSEAKEVNEVQMKGVNEEIGGSDLAYLQESVVVDNTEESIVTGDSYQEEQCVVSNIWATFNDDDNIQIEVEDVKQYIDSNVEKTGMETSENEVQDTSNKSASLNHDHDSNEICQNNKHCLEYLRDNSTSGNVLSELKDNLELEVSATNNTLETQLLVDKMYTTNGTPIANDDIINHKSQSEKN